MLQQKSINSVKCMQAAAYTVVVYIENIYTI